jgi:branched-chain amino acid transport system substrate-binding protein
MEKGKFKNANRFVFSTAIGIYFLILTTVCNIALSNRPDRDYILIGHPNPTTGSLAGFGNASPWTDDRIVNIINSRGGIYIKEYGKKIPVKVKTVDTESNISMAIRVTTNLIVEDKVDLIVTSHTPDVVIPVSAVCEKYKVPCISTDCPVDPWLENGPYEWSYHVFWTVDSLVDLYAGVWDKYADQTNKTVGCLWPDDPDARAWKPVFEKELREREYTVVDYSGFPQMTSDFSPAIRLFKEKQVDIVAGTLIFPDLATFWRQCRKMGFSPKMVTIAKGLLFPSDMESLGGDLPEGLITEVWWSPSHLFTSAVTHETPRMICEAWEKDTNSQYTMSHGATYAHYEIAFDVLARAQSIDKEKIRQAIEETDLDTVFGHVKYNQQHYSTSPLVAGQWTKGSKWPWELNVIYNNQYPEVPTTGQILFPMPKK